MRQQIKVCEYIKLFLKDGFQLQIFYDYVKQLIKLFEYRNESNNLLNISKNGLKRMYKPKMIQLNIIENLILNNIKQVESFQIQINNLKSMVLQQLDQSNSNTNDQMLKQTRSKYSEYSFFKELDIIIIDQQNNNKIKLIVKIKLKQLISIGLQKNQINSYKICLQLNNKKKLLSPNEFLFIDDTIEQKRNLQGNCIRLNREDYDLNLWKQNYILKMKKFKKISHFHNIIILLISQYIVNLRIILFLDQLFYGNNSIKINCKVQTMLIIETPKSLSKKYLLRYLDRNVLLNEHKAMKLKFCKFNCHSIFLKKQIKPLFRIQDLEKYTSEIHSLTL
ncbi:unnamed protein product [Paramecium primaurelia]|uniref:Uncharacterized protein n=1 Tax=Paramecium primaurelia TaxID=5886 RepID=A0A8S1NNY7_PARPR|nr:unnamed protein product [Paramecium primaurelia]